MDKSKYLYFLVMVGASTRLEAFFFGINLNKYIIMNTHEKFLKFNGREIVFVKENDSYWIALKPICEALKVDYIRCFKNVKKDPILGSVLSEQTIQIEKNGKKQGRKTTCIPEEFIYGWLFSLRSDSAELVEYKRTCYRLLYNHFHGTIINRNEIVVEKSQLEKRIKEIKNILRNDDPIQKELLSLEIKKKQLNNQLNKIDQQIINNNELFPEAN